MTIGQMFNDIAQEIKQTAIDFAKGTCFTNFEGMSTDKKLETAIKVAFIAVAAGLITGLIAGAVTGNPLVGVAAGTVIAGTVALCAFAYYTNDKNHDFLDKAEDIVNTAMKSIKNQFGGKGGSLKNVFREATNHLSRINIS